MSRVIILIKSRGVTPHNLMESPCRDHYKKASAIFNECWFDAGDLCLSLADPACPTAQSRLSTQIAIIAGFATSSIPELIATELLALWVKG